MTLRLTWLRRRLRCAHKDFRAIASGSAVAHFTSIIALVEKYIAIVGFDCEFGHSVLDGDCRAFGVVVLGADNEVG